MNKAFAALFIALFSVSALAQQAACVFDGKDYDSAGFSLPARKGLKIVGQFGCMYQCECVSGSRSRTRVTHTLRESHLDLNFSSKSHTGGGSRAKWFICPQSVKPESWKPVYDEIGQIRYYDAQIEDRPFNPARTKMTELETWAQKTCL